MAQPATYVPREKVRAIRRMHRGSNNWRDAALWTCGCNWALRVSDLLAVTVGDVKGQRGIRKSFRIRQRKTGTVVVCDNTGKVKRALEDYLSSGHPEPGNPDAPLFVSRNRDGSGNIKALSRKTAWLIVRNDCAKVGLTGATYSPHSMRKCWGRCALDIGVPSAVVSTKLGHRNSASLLRYLGIEAADVRAASIKVEI